MIALHLVLLDLWMLPGSKSVHKASASLTESCLDLSLMHTHALKCLHTHPLCSIHTHTHLQTHRLCNLTLFFFSLYWSSHMLKCILRSMSAILILQNQAENMPNDILYNKTAREVQHSIFLKCEIWLQFPLQSAIITIQQQRHVNTTCHLCS